MLTALISSTSFSPGHGLSNRVRFNVPSNTLYTVGHFGDGF